MNQCEDRHEPKYRITYKAAKGNRYAPKWLVCEACFENKSPFCNESDIQSIEILA